ncbi:MAG: carbohydrate-binding domain-containing protein [Prevotella sp.]|nr:carbohydrate-binding domain-containing protein [Prevotella sp.]
MQNNKNKWTVAIILMLVTSLAPAFSANNHEVVIIYQGATATVDVAEDIRSSIHVTVNGAHVTVEQSPSVNEEYIYRLSGQSDDGSFTHIGSFKITLSLEGLQLANQSGAAMNIKNGKRIAFVLADGTENVLADQENGTQKACLVVKGHGEFEGGGTLTINGRTKHAYKGDEYVLMKALVGTVNLHSSVKDGFHLDDYFEMRGGTLNIQTTGGGYWDEEDRKTKAPSCINTISNVILKGGRLNMLSTGDGGKGISCDSCFIMTGGELTGWTKGARYIHESYDGDRNDVDNIPDSLKNSPKAIKADLGICITGGTLSLHTEQDGGEGMESKDTLSIYGGTLHIEAYDDCINAAGDVRINGGNLFLNSRDNDGIDTNQSMYVSGGNIVALGSHLHELGIDVNDKSPNKNLYLTGGTVVCVGGTSQVTYPFACEDAQPSIYYRGRVKTGTMLSLLCTTDGEKVLGYRLDRDYSAEAGGKQPILCLMFSSPKLQQGKGYELIDQESGKVMAELTELNELYCEKDEKECLFENLSFKLGNTTLPYRRAAICHDGSALPLLVLYLHGGSSRGNDNAAQLNEAAVDIIYQYLESRQIPATFIVPQCPAGSGWTGQLRKVVNELVKRQAANGAADENRIYVMGGSMGGTGTWCQLSYYPDFYAAAMPVAGNPKGMDAANVATTPVYTVMGSADNLMSMDAVEEFQAAIEEAGGTIVYDVVPGWTHQNTCERSYTDERLDWLFSFSRGEKATLPGDVNEDGDVGVTDVMCVVNYILGNPLNTFNTKNADVNGDHLINITDVMGIVNIILGK